MLRIRDPPRNAQETAELSARRVRPLYFKQFLKNIYSDSFSEPQNT